MSPPVFAVGDRATVIGTVSMQPWREGPLRIVTITRAGKRPKTDDGREWRQPRRYEKDDRLCVYGDRALTLRAVQDGDEAAVVVAKLHRRRDEAEKSVKGAEWAAREHRQTVDHYDTQATKAREQLANTEEALASFRAEVERLDAEIASRGGS